MSGKRIYELTEKSNLENDYFMALDKSGTANAQKVNVSKILNPINNISGSADEYSSSKAYAVGDLVIHDNKLYKCTTACSAAAWSTNSGYFTQSTLTTELTNVKSSLAYKSEQLTTGAFKYVFKEAKLIVVVFNNATMPSTGIDTGETLFNPFTLGISQSSAGLGYLINSGSKIILEQGTAATNLYGTWIGLLA